MKTAGYCLLAIAFLTCVQLFSYQIQPQSTNNMNYENIENVMSLIKVIALIQIFLLFIAGYSLTSEASGLNARLNNIEIDTETNQEKIKKIENKDA